MFLIKNGARDNFTPSKLKYKFCTNLCVVGFIIIIIWFECTCGFLLFVRRLKKF